LPQDGINKFLSKIIITEKIDIKSSQIFSIQKTFKSDIRSMINFLQSNHNSPCPFYEIITNEFWEDMIQTMVYNDDYKRIYHEIEIKCEKYNIEKINFLKDFIDYIIKERYDLVNKKMMKLFTFIIHSINTNFDYLIHFFLRRFKALYLRHCE
jgi:replication factor C subunit 3/5